MFSLDTFLNRFKHIDQPERPKKEAVQKAIQEVLSIDIPLDSLSINKSLVRVHIDSITKTEIFLHKKNILLHIETHAGGIIKDIR